MNEIYIDKKIPSIKVDRDLIIQLEEYFINNVSKIIGINKEIIEQNYSVNITDSLGTEKYDSFLDFPLRLFQNETERIELGYSIYGEVTFSLELSLSTETYSSKIRIRLKANSSRETAQGIFNGVMERIKPYVTYNYIFHKPGLNGVIWGLSLMLFIPIVHLFINKQYIFSIYLLILFLLLTALTNYGVKLKPYCEFETQKQTRINQIFSFLFWGFISYIIFGLGFGLITHAIL